MITRQLLNVVNIKKEDKNNIFFWIQHILLLGELIETFSKSRNISDCSI